nr:unnamed protein product [Callosobruchus analis]
MADHVKLLLASAAFAVLSLLKTKKRKKRFWQATRLKIEHDNGMFHNFCRMYPEDFKTLLELVEPYIMKTQQVPVEVGNALLHELEDDLAALVEESDSSSEADPEDLADAVEAAVNDGVAENAWLLQEVADEEQSNDSAYFSSV